MQAVLPVVLLVALALLAHPASATAGVLSAPSATHEDASRLQARWIWLPQNDPQPYNQTIIARKSFRLNTPVRGIIRITADSFYRLYINGAWINDGPCRAWPEHYQYDLVDVTSWLHEGVNEIKVVARYYGVGDFHRVPQRPGLLAQLDVQHVNRKSRTIITDASWEAALAPAWRSETPKVSIQMEPAEWYDARQESNLRYSRARELFGAHGGPWKNLHPRDIPLLTRQPFALKSFLGAQVVRADGLNFCLPAVRLVHPGLIEANHSVSAAGGMATLLKLSQPRELQLSAEGMRFAIDGQPGQEGRYQLAAGDHFILAFVHDVRSHAKEKALRFLDSRDLTLRNPLQPDHPNPWCYIRFPEAVFATNDLKWINFFAEHTMLQAQVDRYLQETATLLRTVTNASSFASSPAHRAILLAPDQMFVQDSAWQFQHRQVVADATHLIQNPGALMHDTPDLTTIRPSPDGDVELLYDLGEQNCGYYTFDLQAPAGVMVDIFGVEYIAPDGRIQHTGDNRNGLRYITKSGLNRFTSLKRRSGRYLFVTLRQQTEPVTIRHLGLIESTYPVQAMGSFSSSDARLDRIWDISARTLKLCMEDTLTDCPLYEQTHWVGDARNESLYAYSVFGAADLARHCIRQTAQSLERYPITGCQVPSCWDTLIPAWSFLWGISAWDDYWHTADLEFLREIFPAMVRNLKGAESFVNQHDLFSAPFWNFFDWTPIDAGHRVVLYNNMLMVGAVDAALRASEALKDETHTPWLRQLRGRLAAGVNRLWDPARGAYPDSVRDNGSISSSFCQHTSFLAALYDVAPANLMPQLRRNMLTPPDSMVRVGSPFAMQYLYEALDKLGEPDEIVKMIYRFYLPMLEAGATTVWESLPTGTTGSGGFPTRSHCHAWSSAPLLFLNRIILGIQPLEPGAASVRISPRLNGLQWAQGANGTVRGPVNVRWKLDGSSVDITAKAPAGVRLEFAPNDTLTGKTVRFNGKQVL